MSQIRVGENVVATSYGYGVPMFLVGAVGTVVGFGRKKVQIQFKGESYDDALPFRACPRNQIRVVPPGELVTSVCAADLFADRLAIADSVRPQGRPPVTPGEETEAIKLRLGATDHDALVAAARASGVMHAGRPAKGKMARRIITRWLRLAESNPVAARAWLENA